MNNVYIVGDCHLARALEHYYPDQTDINFIVWGKAGTKIFDLDFNKMKEEDLLSSGVEISRGIDHKPIGFSEIKDEGLVMIWLGYIDVRLYFPKYRNPDEIAKYYVDHVSSYFKNARIKFIEPLPQFYQMLLKYEGISPSYTFEERQMGNIEFLNALEKYRIEAGFEESIRQQEILDVLGVDQLDESMTHTDAPHPVDGLKPEYMKKIWDLFERKAKESIDLDSI